MTVGYLKNHTTKLGGGLLSNPSDVFDLVVDWVTNTLGWTLTDTVSAGSDVVVSSAGENADRPTIYVRITKSYLPESKDPIGMHDNIVCRMYRSWNSGTHTGKGEVGRIGPQIVFCPSTGASANKLVGWSTAGMRHIPYSETSGQSAVAYRGFNLYNGKHIYNSQGTVVMNDLANPAAVASLTAQANWLSPGYQGVLVIDSQGREWIYYLRSAGNTAGLVFYKYDIQNQASYVLTDPTNATTPASTWTTYRVSSQLLWDGGDKIYAMWGNATAGAAQPAFEVYTISTDTWAALTAPTTMTYSGYTTYYGSMSQANMNWCYVPGAVTGVNDHIVWIPADSGNAVWRRYDVTAATWYDSPTGTGWVGGTFASLPVNKQTFWGGCVWFEPNIGANGTLIVVIGSAANAQDQMWYYDIATNTFTRIWSYAAFNDVWLGNQNGSNIGNHSSFVRRNQMGALRLPSTSSTLSLNATGSKDFFAIAATWVPTNLSPRAPGTTSATINRFVYAGYYNSYSKIDKFTVNETTGSGAGATIHLNESVTGKLAAGDFIELFNPAAAVNCAIRGTAYVSGGGETCVITAVTDSTHIVVDYLSTTYPANTVVGQDVVSAVVGNDDMHFGMLRSDSGYYMNGEADVLVGRPVTDATRWAIYGRRRLAVLGGIQLFNPNSNRPELGVFGELKGLATQSTLSASGTNDVINGHTYYNFKPFARDLLPDTRGLMIGPLD